MQTASIHTQMVFPFLSLLLPLDLNVLIDKYWKKKEERSKKKGKKKENKRNRFSQNKSAQTTE
jgi:predicted histidine transporter YuiF (NhaC family)